MQQGRACIISNVSKSFGAVRVLRNVSLDIAPGEFVTLLGPSGCGKTTLLRILAGFETAGEGTVRLGDLDLIALPPQRRPINMVFQNYALFPHLTVERNIAFGLRARSLPETDVRRRVAEALEMLRLTDLAHRRPHELSGGQKQRVALSRALVNEPEILLLDEPLSALDAKLRTEVQLELRRLQRRLNQTFILVTHDQDEAMTVSDRIFVMNAGAIEQVGTPAGIYDHPRTRFVATFLGQANILSATRLTSHSAETSYGIVNTSAEIPWQTGYLSIRPERVAIGAGPIQVTVAETTYRGDHYDLLTTSGLRIRTLSAFAPGASFPLAFPAEHIQVLEEAP